MTEPISMSKSMIRVLFTKKLNPCSTLNQENIHVNFQNSSQAPNCHISANRLHFTHK